MENRNYDSLSEAVDDLVKSGYEEDFKAGDESIIGLQSRKTYKPHDLTIVKVFRFEGMSNPADSTELMAIEADDGIKGTLIFSFGADTSQNDDLIRKINMKRST